MWMRLAKALLLIIVTLAISCSVQSNTQFPPGEYEPKRIIFLVSHGWHAGIVVQRVDIEQSGWPELEEFHHVEYLEIGWGDRGYYTSPDPGPGLAARALLLPTSSVLHLAGFSGPPEEYFPHSEIIRIELTAAGFTQLANHISESFSRDASGSAVRLGGGHYGSSWFYASGETYSSCKTCNSWTANVLKKAGCPVKPTLTVDGLMAQARGFGEVIRQKAEK